MRAVGGILRCGDGLHVSLLHVLDELSRLGLVQGVPVSIDALGLPVALDHAVRERLARSPPLVHGVVCALPHFLGRFPSKHLFQERFISLP